MGFSCEILVTKPPNGVHKAGDIIQGTLDCHMDEPVEWSHIKVSLIGKGYFMLQKGVAVVYSERTHGSEEIINRTINILDKGTDQTVTFPAGSYEFSFEFKLPNTIPSSYENRTDDVIIGYRGKWNIKYQLKATFEKPKLLSLNRTFVRDIVIYSTVNPVAPDGPQIVCTEKSVIPWNPLALLQQQTSGKVYLKAKIENSYYTPGETIHLKYEVQNDAQVQINSINTELVQKTTLSTGSINSVHILSTSFIGLHRLLGTNITSDTLEKTVESVRMETHSDRNLKSRTSYFRVSISTKPELYSIQHSKIIGVGYFVRVSLELPKPNTSASLEIPIAIGETHGITVLGDVDILDLEL